MVDVETEKTPLYAINSYTPERDERR